MGEEGSGRRGRVPTVVGSAAGAAALGWCALAICGYRYGVFDQVQYLVQAIAASEPDGLAGDPYLDAFGALRSVFWLALAALAPEAARPAVCLGVIWFVAAANAVLLFRIGRVDLAEGGAGRTWMAAALVPLAFVVPKELNWFGLVSLADVELTATVAVLPFVFGAVLAWTAGRWALAMLLAAFALPVHGQTAAYLLAAVWCAGALTWPARTRGERMLLALSGVLAVVAIGIERGAGGLELAQWTELEAIGRALYAELLDPTVAPWTSWGVTGGLIALGGLAALRLRGDASGPARRLRIFLAAALVFPLLGLAALVAGVEDPLLWRLMIGRSFMVPQIAGLILVMLWAARGLLCGGAPAGAAAVVAGVLIWWPLPDLARPLAAAVLALCLVLVAIPWRGKDTARCAQAPVALGVAGAGLVACAVLAFIDRPAAWLERGADPAWMEVQAWARHSTPPGTRFLTPPYLAGWRVGAHRPTFGEVRDGGLLFFAGAPALDWRERMRRLGHEPPYTWITVGTPETVGPLLAARRAAYRNAVAADPAGLRNACACRYVVLERIYDAPVGPVRWRNEQFVVRELPVAAERHAVR